MIWINNEKNSFSESASIPSLKNLLNISQYTVGKVQITFCVQIINLLMNIVLIVPTSWKNGRPLSVFGTYIPIAMAI